MKTSPQKAAKSTKGLEQKAAKGTKKIPFEILRLGPCSVANRVAAEIVSRSEKGFKKYGVTCDREDLSLDQWLQHLKEELLDAAVYVESIQNALASFPLLPSVEGSREVKE